MPRLDAELLDAIGSTRRRPFASCTLRRAARGQTQYHPVLISTSFCRFQGFETLLGLPTNGQIGCRTAWTNTLRFGTIETMATPIEQIRQLPVAEQLAIVEQIWDGLHDSKDLVQDWQISEARRRSAELDANPSIAISENEVWERVDELLE